MFATANRLLDRESTLDEVIARYLNATDTGETPNRLELLARHGEIASDLAEFFLAQDRLETLTSPLRACTQPDGLATPHRLGDFKIIREIGRGGMGIVHEAEQISLKRRVALKILPFASTLDSRQLQRFKNEAQAAACLHHTNIVPVFATGCEQGVHFYAIQYIEGHSLADVIESNRGVRGVTRSTSSSTSASLRVLRGSDTARHREFANLGIQAAEALDHAHQMGIIHRDVKPGNLMVDERGNLWVMDFGLAQFASDTQLTMTGDLLGTLRFMSPEQALGQRGIVDHRTDVYSLGATLYELLTLHPAFDGKDRQEILRQIAFEEPRSPRKIDKTIPQALETVILKAMAKDPAQRYATAKELADDLRRFVLHEPIKARRPGLVQKVRMWSRRHPGVVGSAAVALVLVTVASVVSTVLVSQAKHEQGVALQEKSKALEVAKKEKERADLEAAITTAVNNFLQSDLLAQVKYDEQMVRGFVTNRDLTLRETLIRAGSRVDRRFQDKPLVEAAIRTTLGDTLAHVGEPGLAVANLERAYALRLANLPPDHPDIFQTLCRLLDGYRTAGQWDKAVPLFEQAVTQRQATHGRADLLTLNLMRTLASTYEHMGRLPEALALFEEVLQLHREVLGSAHLETGHVLTGYAKTYRKAGEMKKAELLFREAHERNRVQFGQTHPVWAAGTGVSLAWVLLPQERYAEAEAFAREVLPIYEKHSPDDWRRFHAMHLLGGALAGQQKYAEAEPLLVEGALGLERLEPVIFAPDKNRITESLERVALFYEATGQSEKALSWREKLRQARETIKR